MPQGELGDAARLSFKSGIRHVGECDSVKLQLKIPAIAIQ